jgi:hypothetical protein
MLLRRIVGGRGGGGGRGGCNRRPFPLSIVTAGVGVGDAVCEREGGGGWVVDQGRGRGVALEVGVFWVG